MGEVPCSLPIWKTAGGALAGIISLKRTQEQSLPQAGVSGSLLVALWQNQSRQQGAVRAPHVLAGGTTACPLVAQVATPHSHAPGFWGREGPLEVKSQDSGGREALGAGLA